MDITSLGLQTDLMFIRHNGHIIDKTDYLIAQTPSNPDFYWGNFLIFPKPPGPNDREANCQLFDLSFPYYSGAHHYVFCWADGSKPNAVEDYLAHGFQLSHDIVLVGQHLTKPTHYNERIDIRHLSSESEWEAAIQNQILCADPTISSANFETFKRQQFANYRKLIAAGIGTWYGAFIGDKLVADLGLFADGNLARYQSVGTHPSYRRQGICATIVYCAGQEFLKKHNIHQLVMIADAQYHAARVYMSVGFKEHERLYSLSKYPS